MRLFAALPLPAEARAAVDAAIAPLRRNDWPVRWIDPDQLHLTLKFYGATLPEALPALIDSLARAVDGTGPIEAELAELGTLPGGRAARVVVAAVSAPPALELLQHRIERAGHDAGFELEGRPFRPHVTVGRVRRGTALTAAHRRRVLGAPLQLPLSLDRVELLESRLASGGPTYTSVRGFPLAACAAA